MSLKISILICSLYERAGMLAGLLRKLHNQIDECNAQDEVEILTLIDSRERSTGSKRNELYQSAKGIYSVSVDDDDRVPPYYISELLKASKEGKDCFAINGVISTNSQQERRWDISIHNNYETIMDHGEVRYLRYPNHITPILSSIAKQVQFEDITFSEDYKWATEIHQRGLLKSQTVIEPPMYYYDYVQK